MICDTTTKVKNLLKRLTETPCLKIVVVMDEIDGETREQAENAGLRLMQLSELEVSGMVQCHLFYISVVCE